MDLALVAGVEKTFRRFPQDDEIDLGRAWIGQSLRDVGIGLDRTDAGDEMEVLAHGEVRCDLGAVGVAHIGQAHGAEQDGIGFACGFHGRIGDVAAGLAKVCGAGVVRFERQPKTAQPGLQSAENLDGRRDDFVPDTVAGKYGNPGVVREHLAIFPMCCWTLRVRLA